MVKHECAQCKKAKARIVMILECSHAFQNIYLQMAIQRPKFPAFRNFARES
jgi:hypothetical protein